MRPIALAVLSQRRFSVRPPLLVTAAATRRFFHTKRAHSKRGPAGWPLEDVEWSLEHRPTFLTTKHIPHRAAWRRFLDPWHDLAECTPGPFLVDKVDSVTRTFGVVGALMTSLSAALLAVSPDRTTTIDQEEDVDGAKDTTVAVIRQDDNNNVSDPFGAPSSSSETSLSPPSSSMTDSFPSSSVTTESSLANEQDYHRQQHPRGTSLLVAHLGVPRHRLHDWYTACCAGAFYGGVGATGLSAVLNAWLAATPMNAAKGFVQHHSKLLVCVPGFLGISTLLAGTALFVGLDLNNGTPISYIGLGGTVLGGGVIGSAALRGWFSTYRSLTKLVRK